MNQEVIAYRKHMNLKLAAVVLVRRMIGPSKSEPLSPRLSPGNAKVSGRPHYETEKE